MSRLLILLVLSLAGISTHALAGASTHADAPAILVFGDSISAGYGLAHIDQGWVGILREKLKSEGYGYQVVNASVSGETTAGGLARLPRALAVHHPQVVILELGANDGLRALPIDAMRANLEKMADLAGRSGARVLLLGMRVPPNYGPEYSEKFYSAFGQVARAKALPLVPFLMADVALDSGLMQADGLHPNERGQPKLLATVWPALKPLLHK